MRTVEQQVELDQYDALLRQLAASVVAQHKMVMSGAVRLMATFVIGGVDVIRRPRPRDAQHRDPALEGRGTGAVRHRRRRAQRSTAGHAYALAGHRHGAHQPRR